MPTYEYVCKACGHRVEVVQSLHDEPLKTCGICGGELRKVFHAPSVSFKGSGFYSTDSRSKPKDSEPSGSEGKPKSSDSESGGDAKKSGDSGTSKKDSAAGSKDPGSKGSERPKGSDSSGSGGSSSSSKERA